MPLVIQEILKKKYTKSENLYYNKNCLKIFIECLKKIDLEESNKKIFFDKL